MHHTSLTFLFIQIVNSAFSYRFSYRLSVLSRSLCLDFFSVEEKERWKPIREKKTLNVACFVSLYFLLTSYKKIFTAGRKCYSFNMQVSVFIDVWRLHATIPCVCVWNWNCNLQPVGIGRVFKRHASSYSIVFGSLQSLPCIFCRNQTKTTPLHLTVSRSEQKTFQRWNMPSLFKLVWSSFFFLPFKQFISS